MSVNQTERNESTAQFITSANELRIFTVKAIPFLNSRYFHLGLKEAYDLSQAIVNDLIRANSLYLSKDKPDNYQKRRDYFDRALGNLNCLSNHLVYLKELTTPKKGDVIPKQNPSKYKITPNRKTLPSEKWLTWGKMINEVKRLVLNVRTSDTKRLGLDLGA